MPRGMRWGLAALLVWAMVGLAVPPRPAEAISQTDLNRALLATVKIWSLDAKNQSFGGCSGSIIEPSGVILTAWHCVGFSPHESDDPSDQGLKVGQLFNPKGAVVVGPTLDPKQAPKPTYIAEYRDGSPKLDVAVLQIVRMYDEKQSLPATPSLPTVPVGDSSAVQIKAPVHVLGYPGVGGPRITVTSGTVSGFDDTAGDGEIDTLKLDASVSSGHSGGPTVDDNGRVVGINSWGISNGADKVDRVVMVNVAKPFIDRTIRGNAPGAGTGTNAAVTTGPFGSITFGTDYTGGKVVGEGTLFPAGTKQICGAWSYSGMTNGTPWGRIWKRNGEIVIDKRNADAWSEGASGTDAYCYTPDDTVEPGKWELLLFVGGKQVQAGTFTVSSSTAPVNTTGGTFSGIRFGAGYSNGQLSGEASVFPSGTKRVHAAWTYSGMKDGTQWGRVWYYNGLVDLDRRNADQWDLGASGTASWNYGDDDVGLDDGDYELALYIAGKEVQRAKFTVGGRASNSGTGTGTGQTATKVAFSGKVVDSATKAAVGGARVMVVQPGTTFDQWKAAANNRSPLIITETTADAQGNFTTSAAMDRGKTYPLAVFAQGYSTTYFWRSYEITVPNSGPSTVDTGSWEIDHD